MKLENGITYKIDDIYEDVQCICGKNIKWHNYKCFPDWAYKCNCGLTIKLHYDSFDHTCYARYNNTNKKDKN